MFRSRLARRSLRVQLAVGSIGLVTGAIALGATDSDDRARAPALLGQSHGLKYVSDQKTITQADAVLVVNCPGRTAVTGGGTFLEDADSSEITNSTPQPAGDPAIKPDEGWLSEGNAFPEDLMLSYAICSNRPGKLRYRSKAILVPADQTRSVTKKCPRGTAVTGGGVLTDSGLGEMTPVASRPHRPSARKPRGWFAAAHNYDGAQQHSLVVYAICSKQKRKYSYKRRQVEIPDEPGFPPTAAHKVVNCPSRRAVSGGGAQVSAPGTGGSLTVSSPQPAGDPEQLPKRGWIGEGSSATGPGTLKVWAICKR